MNLFSTLDRAVRQWPDAIAVVDHRRQMTYRELRDAVVSLARKLRQEGIAKGDKVGVLFARGAEDIVACFAVARLGGVVVQISPSSKAAEITRLSEKLNLDVLMSGPEYESLIPRENGDAVRNIDCAKPFPFCVLRSEQRRTPAVKRQQLLALNAAAIGFSSGTTSESKAIILSHDALLARARMETERFSIGAGDSILYLLSITYGFAPPAIAAIFSGARLLVADAGAPQRLQQLVAEHGVTVVYAAPLNYRMILNPETSAAECFRGARFLVSTGSRLPDSVLDEYCRRVGHEIVNRYGLNECGMVCANLSRDFTKRGSIGTSAGYEVRLSGEPGASPSGEFSGELLVRGPGMFEGYGNPWRSREEFSEEGWFRTGDLARRDKDGYYWIVGRIKEMINVGGLKVIPTEIEVVLLSHPDVEEALVFGVADPRFGEVPHARIKLVAGCKTQDNEILRYIKDKVAFYKSPRAIEIVDQLPKTMTGKIKRAVPA
jgi:long-chain acyl-CoA synthetase